MAQPGGSTQVRSDADSAASRSLTRLSDGRRAENRASAVVIHELQDLYEIRLCAEMDVHALGAEHGSEEPNVDRARHTVEYEAAVSMSTTRTVARQMIVVANHLFWRLPAIDAAFTAGDLDYGRVRTVVLTLLRASDETVSALEADILAAAQRCAPKALRENIWRRWFQYDPDEAAAAQKAALADERCAEIRRNDSGIATLVSKMSVLEGAECDALLDEYVATVCPKDPRTKKELRGHALLALIHREDALQCRCGSEECPFRGVDAKNPNRRPYLLNIHIDIETILGLNEEPATLSDGTVLDAETVRLLATDSRWQVLLTETLTAARDRRGLDNDESADDLDDDGAGNSDEGSDGGDDDDGGTKVTDAPNPRPPAQHPVRRGRRKAARARRVVARGRTRPPAPLPTTTQRAKDNSRASAIGEEAALSAAIAAFMDAVALDPSLAEGPHPDGHGGFCTPPPGALTYRPSAALVALVRASYHTCTFPNCGVPAARCDIDHIVPFDHRDPISGGWTVLGNLHPLCPYHHQAKTLRLWACTKLDGDGIYWHSGAGLQHITPPAFGTVDIPGDFVHVRRFRMPSRPTSRGASRRSDTRNNIDRHDDLTDPPDELYEPTWWEANITDEDCQLWRLLNPRTDGGAPSLADIARLDDPQCRADALYLREKFLEHRAVVAEREKYRPPPF
ncbi:HNH endonuclease signature motif containing protein [Rhodococcus sp. 14-2470-1a]|uniref:HNH endonuclease signature motif containing protein n=1 Tax=Rhodococcus sp. 14-2470-1a TaxID=2023150 RepID=UPI000B9BF59C|nr:HNH endonuclease signature motif containing protein [Rhodococcus sp. 14-2470-1a]OZF50410.1 HNH endonuclease [Rhodococcus sp. 14-2470-1a]